MIDRGVFLEESVDLLVELESALLELERTPADAELVQRVFRALHTIKGSGAMFGFDEVSHFTHQLETAFERVRTGLVPVTPALVNVTLQARDEIKSMLADPDRPGDPGRQASILNLLRAVLGNDLPAPTLDSAAGCEREPTVASRGTRTFRIRFRPSPDILLTGGNPLLLFRELSELGELVVIASTDYLPNLGVFDPEHCFLTWTLELTTLSPRESVADVFIFVEGSSEIFIEETCGTFPAEVETGGTIPSSAPGLPPQFELPSVKPAVPPPPDGPGTSPTADSRDAKATAVQANIRVATDKLDALINLVGELVIVQARLSALAAHSGEPDTQLIAEEVERLTSGLRDKSMSLRMLPLRSTFDRFRRLVHDLTRDLGKEVEFSTEGADTEIDKTVIDRLSDPLLHLIRNSADHGIEPPEVRLAAGKPRAGSIRLSAVHAGAHVLIQVTDDGRGLDAEAIRARAVEKGLISPSAKLSEADTLALILLPGFSTAKQVTDVSGRGVGMDVVRRSVQTLRGSIEVASTPGAGTTVTLRLPLTLAIIDGLLSRVGKSHFVVPVANVIECIDLTREDVARQHGKHLTTVRGELVPYVSLREYLQIPAVPPQIEQVIIIETNAGHFGFAVDEVLGDHQTVIKNLGPVYRDVQVISGATILGDGSVALILDPDRLVADKLARRRSSPVRDRRIPSETQPSGRLAQPCGSPDAGLESAAFNRAEDGTLGDIPRESQSGRSGSRRARRQKK